MFNCFFINVTYFSAILKISFIITRRLLPKLCVFTDAILDLVPYLTAFKSQENVEV